MRSLSIEKVKLKNVKPNTSNALSMYMLLTLTGRVGVPCSPQLDNEERGPADGVDQDNDQCHSDCFRHGFGDAWWRHGGGVMGGIIEGATR